ncbi:unnamed protein product [Owenia fusiformis]|uniref:Uncharacterized protein n=1 Tax=Owenia fusiformis TaxID=6347 RepID=A0A8J1U5B5_OWEFU|nr:unnamed protein product [Owenia fusiformis]
MDNLGDIDVDSDALERILAKCEDQSKESIVSELCEDFREAELDVIRQRFFDVSVTVLTEKCDSQFGPIAQRNKDQIPRSLKLIRRKDKDTKLRNICGDIYDLHVYVYGIRDGYPKSVLGTTSFIPDLKVASNVQNQDVVTSANAIIELKRQLREMSAKQSDCEKDLADFKKKHDSEISKLKKDISLLEDIVQSLIFRVNRTKGEIGQVTKNNSISNIRQTTQSTTLISKENTPSNNKLINNSDLDMIETTCNQAKSADQCKQSDDKQKSAVKSNDVQKEFYPAYLQDKDKEFPQLSTKTNVPTITRRMSEPAKPQENTGWNVVASKKKAPVKMVPFNQSSDEYSGGKHVKSLTPRLKGVAFEKSKTLYLENICQEDSESDTDTIKVVKEYANSKLIKISQIYVVHNKVTSYRVGCKITVPISMVSKAMDDETWPSPVTCREWKPRPYVDRRPAPPPRLRYKRQTEDRREPRPPQLDHDEDSMYANRTRSNQSYQRDVYEYDHTRDPRFEYKNESNENYDWYDNRGSVWD